MDRRTFLGAGALTAGAAAATEADAFFRRKKQQAAARKIRVGVIGCGSVSTQYLPHITKSPHVEVVSVCDIKPERAEIRGAEYNVAARYPHIDAMLAGVPFDLMLNLTDMQVHGELNRKALEAGKHVWSEKPMANTYAESWALVNYARSKNLNIWGAPAVVLSPQFAYMSRAVQAGRMGALAAGHGTYGHTGPEWSAFFYEELGGSLPDLGVYNLTFLTGILGPVRSVSAMTSIVTPIRQVEDKGQIKVVAEDNAMVLMEHGGGAISHVQSGFNYFDPHGHGGGLGRGTISVYGSEGSMHLIGYDWAPEGVDVVTKAEPETKRVEKDTQGYVWQGGATYIAELMAEGREAESLIRPEHAMHVLEIIEAARASGRTGARIPIKSTFKWPVL